MLLNYLYFLEDSSIRGSDPLQSAPSYAVIGTLNLGVWRLSWRQPPGHRCHPASFGYGLPAEEIDPLLLQNLPVCLLWPVNVFLVLPFPPLRWNRGLHSVTVTALPLRALGTNLT